MKATSLIDLWLDEMPNDWQRSRIRNVAVLSPSYSKTRPASDEPCTVVPMEFLSNDDFLYYLMRSMRSIMLRSAVQSKQLNLNYVRIGTNFAPVPPLKEQAAIAEYLDAKEQEFQSISTTIEAQITNLTAYRKSLIHECVTGQRRITEADIGQKQGSVPNVPT